MPSWKIHRKWSRRLNIPDEISKEVDKLIDFPEEWFSEKYPIPRFPRSLTSILEDPDPCIQLFYLSVETGRFGHDMGRKRKWQRDLQLQCVFSHYEVEGVKAVFLHHILDYMETTRGNFEKEDVLNRILQKLEGHRFDNILYEVISFVRENWDEIVNDISKRPKEKRKSNLNGTPKGLKGIFVVNGTIYPPLSAITKIRKEVENRNSVFVKWEWNSHEITRRISTQQELDKLISEIKSLIR